jgi:hypothetical protein
MAWTAVRTWVAGETVTAALLNTHIRDNIDYLKGIVTGSDLQNVAIHANKTLTQGGMRVQRHPYAYTRHMESGVASLSGSAPTGNCLSSSVTWTDAFAATPSAVGSVATITGSDGGKVDVMCASASTTGMSLQAWNASGTTLTAATLYWIAEGRDD